MRNFINIVSPIPRTGSHSVAEAFDDFKDPMLDKPDNGDDAVESDFDMFKDEGDAGAPSTSKDVEEPCGDSCEEVGAALNAKDMKVFASAYKKLSVGAIDSINVQEAKELADIMLALFTARVEGDAIEESNQDNKLAQDAAETGQPVPANPNAPQKPQTPADKRAAATAATNAAAASSAATAAPEAPAASDTPPAANAPVMAPSENKKAGEEAAEEVRKKGVQVKK